MPGGRSAKAKSSSGGSVLRGSQRLSRKKAEEEEARKAQLEAEQEEDDSSASGSEDSEDGGGAASVNTDDDDDVDSSEEEEEEEEEEDDDSDDGRAQSRIVGPVRGRATALAARSPKQAAAKPSKGKAAESATAKDLFTMVTEGRYAFKLIVNDWISEYKTDKTGAVVKLLQFIVKSSGCKATVTPEMVLSRNYDKTFKTLTLEFNEDSSVYPLLTTGPAGKKFKNNFVSFLVYLIEQCQHTLLYDDFFLGNLLPWLMTMTTSHVQAFRHTSTLAAMKICTAFITVAVNVGKELENSQRQLDVERQKTGNRRKAERVEVLEGQLDERKDEVAELEEHMQKIFSGVFIMRYRDSVADIRSLCIIEIGEWIVMYSSTFLADAYLKYIGWMLNDRVSEVRTCALLVLERLYKNEAFHSQLDLFTHKFKDRAIQMSLDVDDQTAHHAVRVASLLLKLDVLDEDNCESVYQLVFARPTPIAQAAGEFLVKLLFSEERLATRMKEDQQESSQSQSQSQSSPRKKRGAASKKNALTPIQFKLKELAKFYVEYQEDSSTEYFVDSLLPHMEELKDWKAYTSLLLGDFGLASEVEECLINIMSNAVKRAVGGQAPPFRAQRSVHHISKKEKKSFKDQQAVISTHFMSCLVALLNKYDADADKVADLLSIPESFDPSLYSELRLEKQLSDFLNAVHRVVFKHSSEHVFEAAARTLLFLQSNDHSLQSSVDVAVESLLDAFAAETKKLHTEFVKSKDKSEEGTYSITVQFRRDAVFSRFMDMSKWYLLDAFQSVLAVGCEDPDAMEDELLVTCLHSLSFGLMQLINGIPDFNAKNLKKVLKTLRTHLQEFVSRCDELISFSSLPVQRTAFHMMSNVVIVANHLKHNKDPRVSALWFEVDMAQQDRCREFVLSSVLVHKDEEQEKDDDDDDEDDAARELKQQRAYALRDRREVLSTYCKLVLYGPFQFKLAAPILAYYVKCYTDYGDIIKYMLGKLREFNHVACAKIMLLTLQLMFEELRNESGDGTVDRQSVDWHDIKELGKRLALFVGVDASRTVPREMLGTIHRDGIVYALSRLQVLSSSQRSQDPDSMGNLDFFDVLSESVFRLHPTDRSESPNSIRTFLEKMMKETNTISEGTRAELHLPKFQPLQRYLSTLSSSSSAKSAAAANLTAASAAAAAAAGEDDVLDDIDDLSLEPPAKRKSTARGRTASTSSRTGNSSAAATKKKGAEDVWLQRPSEAEVRQQKKEKARVASARQRTGQGRASTASTASRAGRGKAANASATVAAITKRRRQSSSESEQEDVHEEEEENAVEESEEVQKSSQASWLSSQPKRVRPETRRSYGGKTRSPQKARSNTSRSAAADEDSDAEADFVATPTKHQPRRNRRAAAPLPENIFDEAMGGDDSD